MDWARAIRRNRDQLRQIVLALFALAGMRVGGSLFTLRRSVMGAIMLVLRPAESAVRRLIVIAAQDLAVQPRPLAGPKAGETGSSPWAVPGIAGRRGLFPPTPAFKLFDPLKVFDPESIWDAEPVWQSGYGLAPSFTCNSENPDHLLDATLLGQRLNALIRAIDNLPHQARRLARWQAKRDERLKVCKPTRISPLRPGLPPGWRERKIHEIDVVLRECHGLANDRLNAP